jgi:hypothetical protein
MEGDRIQQDLVDPPAARSQRLRARGLTITILLRESGSPHKRVMNQSRSLVLVRAV